MVSNVERAKAKARLLLAADKWRELSQFLESDVPALLAEVERLPGRVGRSQAVRRKSSNPRSRASE